MSNNAPGKTGNAAGNGVATGFGANGSGASNPNKPKV